MRREKKGVGRGCMGEMRGGGEKEEEKNFLLSVSFNSSMTD